ncbi:hypothetical protein [Candidatus Kuenenia sp.]|uniref:hypothetical protein n=1 Tax=Candidatus Kuenenia sp. TaxID=2499824 RepID=UPI0032209DA6
MKVRFSLWLYLSLRRTPSLTMISHSSWLKAAIGFFPYSQTDAPMVTNYSFYSFPMIVKAGNIL